MVVRVGTIAGLGARLEHPRLRLTAGSACGLADDLQAEMRRHRIVVTIRMQEAVLALDAKGPDQQIDGLADGDAEAP